MKKYFMTMAVMAFFAIGFSASNEDNSSSETNAEKVEQAQEVQQQPQKNPLENFIGTYHTYDTFGNTGNGILVVDDGRFFYKNGDDSNTLCGKIDPISDKAFSVYLSKDFYGIGDNKVWSYKNDKNWQRQWKIGWGNTIVIDLSDNKLYVNKSEYNNRDYESPEYYHIRFTKQ